MVRAISSGMAHNETKRIVRLIAVRDTRSYQECGDRMVPMPGTGDAHDCARCGRSHEVHAEIECADGSRAIVGTGCMDAAFVDATRRAAGSARTVARLRAELARDVTRVERARSEAARVAALPAPRVEIDAVRDEHGRVTVRCDGVTCRLFATGADELTAAVVAMWRSDQLRAAGVVSSVTWLEETARETAKRLARAMTRSAAPSAVSAPTVAHGCVA